MNSTTMPAGAYRQARSPVMAATRSDGIANPDNMTNAPYTSARLEPEVPYRFAQSIIDRLTDQASDARGAGGAGMHISDLMSQMNVAVEDQAPFEQEVRKLAEEGRVIVAGQRFLTLPPLGNHVTGTFSQTSRGFGFVKSDVPTAHGDLFIPIGNNMDAMTGDVVVAKVVVREKYDTRDPKKSISGRIVEILKRATNKFVGTLTRQHNRWLVVPDGNVLKSPIEIQDVTAKSAKENDKVVVELLRFPTADRPAEGVITEVLGERGEPEVELQSVIHQFDLPRDFPAAVIDQARKAATTYDPANYQDRDDLTDEVILTIDPDDARDFDDAISLRILDGRELPHAVAGVATRQHNGSNEEQIDELVEDSLTDAGPPAGRAVYELGVHIADVSAFVPVESPLDLEARSRGNSIYFPRYVIPMLPEILSNGVCSLQENQPRLTKSAFISYDARGNVVGSRFANTIIHSKKRLIYRQAQAVIDDAKGEGQPYTKGLLESPPNPNVPQVAPEIRELLLNMDRLARVIQNRRIQQGMITLDLPEVELVMDDDGRVIDAKPEDNSFTHKIIEMFMVEANEAVARFLTKKKLPVLRRVHPEPDQLAAEQVRQFVLVAGKKLPKVLDRKAVQQLLESVRGTPIAYAVSLAILKTFTTAEYSPLDLGHYALASTNYAHFTSPIRRYADLVIHRELDFVLTGGKHDRKKTHRAPLKPAAVAENRAGKGPTLMPAQLGQVPDYATLVQLGKHISFTERRAQDAERELRAVKVLQLLAEHTGDTLDGVVTGTTGFGIFVQSTRFLIEGLIRIADLPNDFWRLDERTGSLRGERSGRRIALGDRAKVQIVAVNIPGRSLELRLLEHGSSIGGEATLRKVEPRQKPKLDESRRPDGEPESEFKDRRKRYREAAGKKTPGTVPGAAKQHGVPAPPGTGRSRNRRRRGR